MDKTEEVSEAAIVMELDQLVELTIESLNGDEGLHIWAGYQCLN